MFSTASQFEDEDDLVNNCLCKLQDGLKVKPGEATEALRQYGRFRAEMDRLQQRLERPSKNGYLSNKENLQYKKIADSVLLSLFMRIMESATILKPPRTTFLYVQKQSFKDRADKIIAMKEKEISHTRTPRMTSSLYVQEKSFKDRTDKIIAKKEKEISLLKQKLTEVSTRLAALVGTQNFNVDDNRSDLTDPFKPTKLAEDYRAIYDNEWETAYEELEVVLDEPKILIYLGKVTWVAYQFCTELAEQQLTDLMKKEIEIIRIMSKPSYEEAERRKPLVSEGIQPRKFERDETFNLLKRYRRCLARTAVPGVQQIFLTLMSRTPPTEGGTISDGVKAYLLKIAKLTYLMCIQEPPMLLEWVRFGDILDPEKFKPYTSSGNSIVGTVWPVVLLHANGPVMSRGVVDMMISQSYR